MAGLDHRLEMIIQKLRNEFDNRKRYHGERFHGSFRLEFEIQDGKIIHGVLNGVRFHKSQFDEKLKK